MPYSDVYLHSPLSMNTVKQGDNRALLLQFILSEIFCGMDAHKKEDPFGFVFSSPACFFPYDWSYEVGCLNKIAEHAQLLPHAFPQLKTPTNQFIQSLNKILSDVVKKKKLDDPVFHETLYQNNLKNREFDKEAPQNFCSERATIAKGQGASKSENSGGKPTQSETNSSGCFGIVQQLNTLCICLEPFLIACKNSESLTLFLIKQDEISNLDSISFLLKKMFPEGLKAASDLLKKEYGNRNFHSFLPEIDRLLSRYEP